MRTAAMIPAAPSRLIARTKSTGPAAATNPTTTPGTNTTATDTTPTSDAAADFKALFTMKTTLPPDTRTAVAPAMAPTAESLFGPNPWMSDPGGVAPNGVTYGYNKYYFATAETAARVGQMVGGTVVQKNALTPYGPFVQNRPNYMVQLPNGREIYAGLFAEFFDHGYTQEFVNRLVAAEIGG
jgi:hypothetical protein